MPIVLAQRHVITTSGADDKFLRLHHQLGHISFADTLAYARKHGISIGKYAALTCDSCAMHKSRRKAVPRDAPKDHHAPLSALKHGRLGTDLQSVNFWSHCIDRATRVAVTVPMQSVSVAAVAAAIEKFYCDRFGIAKAVKLDIHLGPRIQSLQTRCRQTGVYRKWFHSSVLLAAVDAGKEWSS